MPLGDVLGLSASILVLNVQQRPVCQYAKFRSLSDNPSTWYLLPEFVDFVDSMTDKNTHKKTVNDVSTYPVPCGDNSILIVYAY